MTPMYLFVYGTLMRPHHNSYILERSSDFVDVATTCEDFLLVTCGFPYMIPKEALPVDQKGLASPVKGQVWEVHDEQTLVSLNRLEGVSYNHYRHRVVSVKLGSGVKLFARAYVPHHSYSVNHLTICPKQNGVFSW
jgi:gamma-glutamylcyclotransferase (GGCT)/AIG2-like uncharacterized protein YtfP